MHLFLVFMKAVFTADSYIMNLNHTQKNRACGKPDDCHALIY